MAPHGTLDLSPTLAVLLAGGEGSRLHELSALEAKAALPLAGRRLADFACAAAAAAGLPRLAVVLPGRAATLASHLRDAWGDRLSLSFHDGSEARGTVTALERALLGETAREVLVLPADQVHALDLMALLSAHRAGGATATLARPAGLGPGAAPLVIGRAALTGAVGDLWADLLGVLAARGEAADWEAPPHVYWRDVDTLDDLRTVALDLRRDAPLPLPPGGEGGPLGEEEGRDLALEVGGLRLTAPRFGARQRGRWTLLEDSLVLPGGRVTPGARLSRTIVAPGAVVPANLTVGDDPTEDARWFRVTPGGTTLITAPMLARRAAERMRAQFGGRLPGLATPKAQ